MTGKTHLARTIGVALVALGLMAQAAQANPFGLPPQGAAAQARAASQQPTVSPHSGQLGAAVAAANRDSQSRPGHPVAAAPTVLHQGVVTAHGTAAVSRSVYWMAVLGGTAIIALIGGLFAITSRQQPQRPHRPAIA
jgi:hypothetical protein